MGKLILLFLLNLILLSSVAFGATVHGTIYDSDLETISKVVVEVNSIPLQRHVSKYGGYSFELEPGSYHIVAFRSHGEVSSMISEEFFEVESDSGDYIVDLFLFPGVNISGDIEEPSSLFDLDLLLWFFLSLAVVIIGVLILTLIKFLNRPTRQEPVVEYNIQYSEDSDHEVLTDDVKSDIQDQVVTVSYSEEDDLLKKRILKILDDSEGSIPQKEIRKKIRLSESKISEVISALEKEGSVSKIKKGRANVIVKNN